MLKKTCSIVFGAFNVTKINRICEKLSKIWFIEVKGANVKFKHKKIIYVLKLIKMYVHWSNAFALQKSFLKLQISRP